MHENLDGRLAEPEFLETNISKTRSVSIVKVDISETEQVFRLCFFTSFTRVWLLWRIASCT